MTLCTGTERKLFARAAARVARGGTLIHPLPSLTIVTCHSDPPPVTQH
jgi:hypothetical protein